MAAVKAVKGMPEITPQNATICATYKSGHYILEAMARFYSDPANLALFEKENSMGNIQIGGLENAQDNPNFSGSGAGAGRCVACAGA